MGQSTSKRESGASVQQRTNTGTSANGQTYVHLIKLLVIGGRDTGKNSLNLRFVDDTFTPTFIPREFRTKTVSLDGLRVELRIWPWDNIRSERWRRITELYYHGISGIMMVYSATKESTLDQVSYWLDEIKEVWEAPPGVPVVLVGTKCDLVEEKEVEYERARDFANERGLLLFETSAKDGTNVELAFLTLVAAALELAGHDHMYRTPEKPQENEL